MDTRTLEIKASQWIRIQAHGNLGLRGWDQNNLSISTQSAEDLRIQESGDEVLIQAETGCQLQVPWQAEVQIDFVHGNAGLQDLSGDTRINRIGGNLALKRMGPTSVDKVYGNLRALEIDGRLSVRSVYGNTQIREVRGRLEIEEQVKGNLMISDAAGLSASALGNARLNLNPQAGEQYDVEVSGNIHCRISSEGSARIEARSGSRRIRLELTDQSELLDERSHQVTIGAGEAQVNLAAKGYVQLADRPADQDSRVAGENAMHEAEDFSQEINNVVSEHMDALEQQLSDHLSNLSDTVVIPDLEDIVEKARAHSLRAASQAQAQAQAAARRAQEKLSRKLEQARRRADRRARKSVQRKPAARHTASPYSASATDPVSEEERLLVLRMLEEKKITLQEAEQLLDVIEEDGD